MDEMDFKYPQISVLIPVYNGERYIERLLKSLINQTYRNFEVLCVDDFSTDNSVSIIEKYATSDNRIKLVHRSSKGGTAAKAEEYALPLCKGEYYFYLSQDDYIDVDLFEKAIRVSIEKNADVVMPNTIFCYPDSKDTRGIYPPNKDYDVELSAKEAFFLSIHWKISGFCLYKMDLVKSVNYVAKYYNSDEYYAREYLSKANKIAFCNANFYYEQGNENAITHSKHYFDIDMALVHIELLKLMYKMGMEFKGWLHEWIVCVYEILHWPFICGFMRYKGNERWYILKRMSKGLFMLMQIVLFVIVPSFRKFL